MMSNLFELLESMTAERRRYILESLIHHLYLACEWPRLFDLLDSRQYGQAKLQDDPSARSYVRDLDLGRQAAASEEWTFEKKLDALPHLWQYTLLRCNLANQADLYPLAAFRLLVLLGREQEALSLAELLTDTGHRVEVLIEIAEQIRRHTSQEEIRVQVLLRACAFAYGIEEREERAEALSKLGQLIAHTQLWERAEAVISSIEAPEMRARAIAILGRILAQAQQWNQSERMICSIEESEVREGELVEFIQLLAQHQQWKRAEEVIDIIKGNRSKLWALCELGQALTWAQQLEKAEVVWAEIEGMIRIMDPVKEDRASALGSFGLALARSQHWKRVEHVLDAINNIWAKAFVLVELGRTLTRDGRLEQADKAWAEIQEIIRAVEAKISGTEWTEWLYWLLGTSVRKDREQTNLCSMERQRNAPASREKDRIFSSTWTETRERQTATGILR